MSLPSIVYRDQIVRMVLGTAPAMLGKVADPTALERLCEHLAQCEGAHATLKAKHYGTAGMTIDEVAKTVPEAPKAR